MNLPAASRRGINNIFSTRNAASCGELTLKEIKIPYPQMDVRIKDSDDKNDVKI